MKVVLRDGQDGLLAFGVVDDDGYDGTPILEWEGRHFTPTGIVTEDGFHVYAERRVRSVRTPTAWGK